MTAAILGIVKLGSLSPKIILFVSQLITQSGKAFNSQIGFLVLITVTGTTGTRVYCHYQSSRWPLKFIGK